MMRSLLLSLLLLVAPFVTINSSNSPCIPRQQNYYVNTVIDLKGKTLQLPEGGKMVIGHNGCVKNGVVEGNNTRLSCKREGGIATTLSGTWNTSDIRDSWFDDTVLSGNMIIDNLNVLQSDRIEQDIWITRNHQLTLSEEHDTGLKVSSNTTVHLDATISIDGNDLKRYNIISVNRKQNVRIEGGKVLGDVGKHRYVEGSTSEWGFGVYVYKSNNISISDLTISHCTGDAFYISGPADSGVGEYSNASKDVRISQCVIDDCRREGISLVHAEGVVIEDCRILNMGQTEYTAPSYGINIEPNKNCSVRNVLIQRVVTENTKAECSFSSGGYQLSSSGCNRNNVVVRDCKFDKGVAIMSSGVQLINTSMSRVIIYPVLMPDEKVAFTGCTINGGSGIYLNGKKAPRPESGKEPEYSFIKCTISASEAHTSNPALIWGSEESKLQGITMWFDRCQIALPRGQRQFSIISKGIKMAGGFKRCNIDAQDYRLDTRGLLMEDCTIKSK